MSILVDDISRAEALFTQGEVDQARMLLEALLPQTAADPRARAEVLSDLAVIAAGSGGFDEAARLASQALACRPDHAPAREVLAVCMATRERAVAAVSNELQSTRIEQYKQLSTCIRVTGEPELLHPLLLRGLGRISFGERVRFGWPHSPGFYSQYSYVDAHNPQSHIEIGDDTTFNNTVTLRSEGPGISIGRDCLFGWSVQVVDSDFHDLHPRRRNNGTPKTKHVSIGNNVFIGANVIVMKGVTIGDDTVVGAGSVVTQSLPAGVIAAGNPARVIRALED